MDDQGAATLTRGGAVWLGATAALVALAAWLLPGLARAWRLGPALAAEPFDRLLVSLCTVAALGCAAWLWALTTVVVAQAVRGRAEAGAPGVRGALCRLLLVACGVSLVGAAPAAATPDPVRRDRTEPATSAVVRGLPLPDRATGRADRVVVVRPGDTLWALAERGLPAAADAAAVTARWHRIYALNRAVVGADPDLIQPAQRLRVPPA